MKCLVRNKCVVNIYSICEFETLPFEFISYICEFETLSFEFISIDNLLVVCLFWEVKGLVRPIPAYSACLRMWSNSPTLHPPSPPTRSLIFTLTHRRSIPAHMISLGQAAHQNWEARAKAVVQFQQSGTQWNTAPHPESAWRGRSSTATEQGLNKHLVLGKHTSW